MCDVERSEIPLCGRRCGEAIPSGKMEYGIWKMEYV